MEEITFETLKNNVAFKKIPILTLNEKWYQLIPEKNKTHELKKLEKQLNDLLKKQGQVTNDLKEVKKIKAKLIQDVVENMENDEISPEKHHKKMSQDQKLIQEAKEKISELEEESLDMPKMLAEANQGLLIETINYCYERLNTNKEDVELLDKWINETRIKLKKNLLIKQDKESKSQLIYALMHDILGPEVMGLLDKINEQQN